MIQVTRPRGLCTATAVGVVALLLAMAVSAPTIAYAADAADYTKDENVYGVLAANGQVDDVYVVNQFDVARAGEIKDYGAYDKVTNLTTTDSISTTGDMQTLNVSKGMFYYQGDIASGDLPWTFDITYYLDGEEVSADELAGASGRLQIHIASSANEDAPGDFASTYVLQVSISVPAQDCHNIDAGSGTIANAGANRQVTYTVMPGSDADITFAADVENFEMDAISIAGASAAAQFEAAGMQVEPQSFASSENDDVIENVQFVLTTQAIEIPEDTTEEPEEPTPSFVERVLALFGL